MKIPYDRSFVSKISKYSLIFFTVGLYSLSTVCAKTASGYPFLSGLFIFYYGLELSILIVYAVLWQQILKKFSLSVAYAFRSLAIFWVMLWSITIFGEFLSVQKLIGVIIVFGGTMIVNRYE